MREFTQKPPELKNQYESDLILKDYLRRLLDRDAFHRVDQDFSLFGAFVAGPCMKYAQEALRNPPVHEPYDAWGNRSDFIHVSKGWEELHKVAAREGIVAMGYEREFKELSRPVQFAKLYLFHPSSAIYSCPLAMTDGAAKLIETIGDDEVRSRAFKRLTSRDPEKFWTSGQWMTEKTGGSDVRTTSTTAVKKGDHWELSGVKWFSSATTSEFAVTLAREENGQISSFYLETKKEDGDLNGIKVLRLKNKLGTEALPTAELELKGAKAYRIGEAGKGIKNISLQFNVTRIYNAFCAVANMRRLLSLSTDYAKKREAFGKKLIDLPLHRQGLFGAQTEFIGCFQLVFKCAELLGQSECSSGKEKEKASGLLRILTPLAKLYTGKKGVLVCSELLESFGGAGYIEDTGIPQVLKDAQVLSIWEGTTNVLSLDVLRSILKEDSLKSLIEEIHAVKKRLQSDSIPLENERLDKATAELEIMSSKLSPENLEPMARDFSFFLAKVYIGWLLKEVAQKEASGERGDFYKKTFQHWCEGMGGYGLKGKDHYQVSLLDLIS